MPAPLAVLCALLLLPRSALAASAGAPHLDGAHLGPAWVVPFAGILLSIALFPLTFPHFWHRHFGKVAAFWALLFLVPFAALEGPEVALYEVLHTLFLEYLPFVILLLALFTVAGGVRLTGAPMGTPAVNTAFLLVGTLIASWMGTTGAAMLLIRPLIRANAWRRHTVHVLVFFIFLVANVGGALTPLGDPPLFLGFLKGVSFFWPTVHLFLPMLLVGAVLLGLFFLLDSHYHARERPPAAWPPGAGERFGIEGGVNLLLLAGIVGAVLLSGMWRTAAHVTIHHVDIALPNILRDLLLLGITYASWRLTSAGSRRANDFDWFPMIEVAKLFAAIFLTIIPAIAILRAGTAGALAPVVAAVTGPDGQPVDAAYFWATGILSSFLDNAPTYLVFFNIAGGDAKALMTTHASTLTAISAGAVFMGAATYIGNAPNFMVRSIAEASGLRMPSFFGYMAWSGVILMPLFALVTLVFFS